MADFRAAIQAALVDRYRVERELGHGGMATVYLAHDLRHDRPVALKVLHPELAASVGSERFQREIRLVARLQHPHILSIHDSGEVAGDASTPPLLWFAMPFVEGESLRDQLARERQLPLEDAVRIGREAADALEYAHRHGVVHRDIKPENILLSAGHALVADFGIARALADQADSKLTETGTTLGTPAYMSPEQAAGERSVDHRSDIYSLACVLFEAIAGEPPFTGPTAQSIIARRFTETPRPLRELRETVPAAVERAVAKALARSPADRYGSAAEFARALAEATTGSMPAEAARPATVPTAPTMATAAQPVPRQTRRFPGTAALAIGFVLGLGVLFGWLRSHGHGGDTPGDLKRLAVLPFENLGAGEDEYFADGVTDEVRGKLASLAGLQVIARSSSGQYKKTTKSPQEIGRELGVDYLLTGTVRWEKGAAGNRVRVSPELIQVGTAATTWQQPFDASITDVFQVQADIAGRVAEALDVALGAPQKETLAEKPTENLAAYEAFLKGEEAGQGIAAADPRAHPPRHRILRPGGGARLDVRAGVGAALPRTLLRLQRRHAHCRRTRTAPAARRRGPSAWRRGARRSSSRCGDYQQFVRTDYAAALAAYEAGLAEGAGRRRAAERHGRAEQSLGRWEASAEHFARANAVDPRSALNARRQALALLWLQRYPEADAALDRGLAVAPSIAAALLGPRPWSGWRRATSRALGRCIKTARPEVEPTAMVSNLATYWDLFWILDEPQQQLLLRLTPSAFDDDRGAWGIALAATYHLRGDQPGPAPTPTRPRPRSRSRSRPRRTMPSSTSSWAPRSRTRAEGRGGAPGEESLEMAPITKDAYSGAYNQHQLARIYILVGEPDKALDQLEPLLKLPYYLTPAWLRIDPTFEPLRSNPRFQRLAGAK